MLLDHAGLVVEPSAALGIAAILEDRDRFAGRHVVTIVYGSNVDIDAYHRWVGAAPSQVLTIALGRPAMGSDSTISQRGRQGPPLPRHRFARLPVLTSCLTFR